MKGEETARSFMDGVYSTARFYMEGTYGKRVKNIIKKQVTTEKTARFFMKGFCGKKANNIIKEVVTKPMTLDEVVDNLGITKKINGKNLNKIKGIIFYNLIMLVRKGVLDWNAVPYKNACCEIQSEKTNTYIVNEGTKYFPKSY